ncbi:MAG: SpoIIE family protein phosphatase [Chitinivibrionales bacterium]|nr:SpoIIE family protein phosphatase [Chitinivibrionales bacterium]
MIVVLFYTLCAGLVVAAVMGVFLYRKYPLHLIYKSKLHLEAAFDSIIDPLAIIDSDYRILRVNRAYTELVGKSYWEVLHKRCYQVLRERKTPCEDCRMLEVLDTGAKRFAERSPHPRNPGSGFVTLTFYPFSEQKVRSDAIVENVRDITELERLKIELEQQNVDLAQTTKRLQIEQVKTSEELELARQIQLGLLPQKLPVVPGLKIDATYHPVEAVGGDVYDFIRFSESQIGLFIGDASGHGLASAFIGTISKMALFNHTKSIMPPHELLSILNKDLNTNINTNHYLTCFWAIFDIHNKTINFARAGHPKPLAMNAEHKVSTLEAAGTFVGIIDNPEYEQQWYRYTKGERFYFFTDGIYEIMGQQDKHYKVLGYRQFAKILQECNRFEFDKVIPAIKQQLSQFTYEDDYTLVVVEID